MQGSPYNGAGLHDRAVGGPICIFFITAVTLFSRFDFFNYFLFHDQYRRRSPDERPRRLRFFASGVLWTLSPP